MNDAPIKRVSTNMLVKYLEKQNMEPNMQAMAYSYKTDTEKFSGNTV